MIGAAHSAFKTRPFRRNVERSPGPAGGWLAEELRQWKINVAQVRRSLPKVLLGYLCLVYMALALLVWWVPANDFDTMSSYLARIQLERIGPLRETGTLELQYIFPKFFDYLHAPLLDWGWFTTLPNFALFTIVMAVAIRRFSTAMAVRFILGLAISAPVLVAVTSAKNDITVGLFGLLCWFWIYYAKPERAWYLTGVLLLVSMLVGTKWHGLALAPMFAALAALRIWRERALTWSAVCLLLVAAPLAWRLSSADVYFENLQREGSICPSPAYVQQDVNVPRNLWAFASNQVLETFEVPFYLADAYLHTDFWSLLQRLTKGAKLWTYAILPNSHVAAFGAPLLLVILASFHSLLTLKTPPAIRASAFLAIAYGVLILERFDYTTGLNRYFLPCYLFGLVPAAHLLQQKTLRGIWRWAFYSYMVVVSAHAILFNQEKQLAPLNVYNPESRQFFYYPTIFVDGLDRDSLYCQVWSGYKPIYKQFRDRVKSHHQLLIVNSMTNGRVPFIYPFIRGRSAANTRVVNARAGQSPPRNLQRFDFVVAFWGEFNEPGFTQWLSGMDIAIYAREGGSPAR